MLTLTTASGCTPRRKVGTLVEGDLLEFEPSGAASAAAAVARAGTTALKRGALRVFDALMPRGE